MSTELDNSINKIEVVDETSIDHNASEVEPIKVKKTPPKYLVMSIDKIDTPEGMPEGNWHRYIVGQGTSKIEGLKAGTLKEVTAHADLFAEDLNGRSKSGSTAYAARKQKATPPTPPPPATAES